MWDQRKLIAWLIDRSMMGCARRAVGKSPVDRKHAFVQIRCWGISKFGEAAHSFNFKTCT